MSGLQLGPSMSQPRPKTSPVSPYCPEQRYKQGKNKVRLPPLLNRPARIRLGLQIQENEVEPDLWKCVESDK